MDHQHLSHFQIGNYDIQQSTTDNEFFIVDWGLLNIHQVLLTQ
jgi:hypothetical protein